MADLFSSYPPTLSDEQRESILTELKDWSIAHGLAVRPPPTLISDHADPKHVTAITAPVTIFPSLFPAQCFEQAHNAARAYNELYSAIASDEAWLKVIVEELIEIDDFMKGLWEVHLKVKAEGYAQTLQLGLFRSDYMIHQETGSLDSRSTVKQVEFNTIASSFGGLSSRVSQLHAHLHKTGTYSDDASRLYDADGALPPNQTITGLATGLAKAHEAYGTPSSGLKKCVVFLVQNPERNVFDQRHVEYELSEKHEVLVFRLPWDRVLKDTRLDEKKNLIYTAPADQRKSFEISTVYFRAGYAPTEYTSQESWDARLHIEGSRAIKCPSVLLQLAGTKKVQQVLATPHSPHLSKFLPNESDAEVVESTFAPIYPLDKSEAGLEARKLALDEKTAEKFVLKPQREGGGNNIYRSAIPDYLKRLPQEQWPAYILMEMIEPPSQKNVIFRNGEIAATQVICELGIYGVCLWNEEQGVGKGHRKVIENSDAGYLLRTKGADSSEGGVAAGFGSVDSVCLVKL